MKKLLLSLLATSIGYAQVPADATPLENIQITNNVTSTTATKVVVQESTGVLNTKPLDATVVQNSINPITGGAVFTGLASKVSGTGVSGQVSFWNGTNSQTGDNGLFWNNSTKRLGIGTSTQFDLFGYGNFGGGVTSELKMAITDGTTYINGFAPVTNGSKLAFGYFNALGSRDEMASIQMIAESIANGSESSSLRFFTKSGLATTIANEKMRITPSGRVLFNTTTDNLTDIAQFNGSAISTAWKVTGGLVTQYQTGTGTVVDFGTSVRGSLLTGYVSGAGTVAATDNILQAIQKLNGNDVLKAPLASPAFTGTPTAPTATAGTNTTQVATTEFVLANTNANAVLLTGNQTIQGTKTFNNTTNPTSVSLINGGVSGGILTVNNTNTLFAVTGTQSGSSGQLIRFTAATGNNSIFSADGNVGNTGNLFSGFNNGTLTFSVNKEGNITANKLIIPNAVNANEAVNKGQLDAVASSGSYTPTLTAGANCSNLVLVNANFIKIGNVVNVKCIFTGAVTAPNTVTGGNITLPINKTVNTNINSGTVNVLDNGSTPDEVGLVEARQLIATFNFNNGNSSGSSRTFIMQFQYDTTQ